MALVDSLEYFLNQEKIKRGEQIMKIALIPGDGIGVEGVIKQATRFWMPLKKSIM